MKYDSKKLDENIKVVDDMVTYLHDNIVWEGQAGQPDHFDRLPKVEQVALMAIFCKATSLRDELIRYKHWFEQN